MISIIIPYFNRWDLTHARLADLYYHMPKEGVEVILIDDASTEMECQTGVKFWQTMMTEKGGFPIRYHRHTENGGFGKSMNDGCKMAKGDVVILLSNDVKVMGDFTKPVLSAIAENVLIGGEVVDWAGGWNEFEVEGRKFFLPYANGWFLACTKRAWDEIGGFDPIYHPYDCEDMDLSFTAQLLGYRLHSLRYDKLQHAGGATIYNLDKNRQETTKRNRQKLIAKWGSKLLDVHKKITGTE